MIQVHIGTTNYGKHWLDAPAAESWFRMVRDGCPPQGITDGGRTDAEQVAVFLKYFTTDYASSAKKDRRVWEGRAYWRRPGKPSAATPGSTQARHVSGRALDLNGSTKAWVRANGHRYGWIKDIVPGEDWHMEYQSHRDVVLVSNPGGSWGGALPSVDTRPIAPIEEDIMAALSHDEQRALLTLLREVRTQTGNIQSVAAKLDDRMHRTNVSMDLLAQVHGGVGTIEGLVRQIAAAQGVDIDEAALARELAPLLTASVGALSDADVARLADAVADEQARRMAG